MTGSFALRGGGRGSRLAFPLGEVVSWIKEEVDWGISPLGYRHLMESLPSPELLKGT